MSEQITVVDKSPYELSKEDKINMLKNRKVSDVGDSINLLEDITKALNTKNEKEFDFDNLIEFSEVDLPSFPLEVLSPTIRETVTAVAEFTQTPVDLAAMVVQGVLSTVLSKKFEVQPKKNWTEPVNTYILILLDSSNRKSAVFEFLVKPILSKQKKLSLELEAIIEQRKIERTTLEKRIEKLQTDFAKTKDLSIKEEIKEIVNELQQLPELKDPALVVDNITEEALVKKLVDNGEKIAILSDEGDLIERLKSMGPDNAKRDPYLKGYSGSYLRTDRISRDTDVLYKPLITIGISAQPNVIKNMTVSMKERGVVPRFIFSLPLDFNGYRNPDSLPVSEEIEERYTALINRFLDFSPEDPVTLTFNKEAQEEFIKFQYDIEKEFRSHGIFDSELRSWGGKLVGQLVRFTALMHISLNAESCTHMEDIQTEITKETLMKALRLKDYFIAHAKKAFGIMQENPAIEDAKYVLNKILGEEKLTLSKQDVWQKTKVRFEVVERLNQALRILETRSYIQLFLGGKSGRKECIRVNPLLFQPK